VQAGYYVFGDDQPISAIPVDRERGFQGRSDFLTGPDSHKPLTNIMVRSVGNGSEKISEASEEDYKEMADKNPGGNTVLVPRHVTGPEEFYQKVYEDERFTEVSPYPIRQALGKKSKVHELLTENEIPTIPTEPLLKPYIGGSDWAEDALGKANDLVIKPDRGAGGQLVERHSYDTYEGFVEQNTKLNESFKKLPTEVAPTGSGVAQPFVDHNKEIRVYVNEDGVLSGELKRGSEKDFRCNLSQLEGESPSDKAVEAYEEGAAKALGEEELPRTVREISEEFSEILDRKSDGGEAVANLDIIEADESLDWMPQKYRGDQGTVPETSYLVVEAHPCYGGDIGDRLHFNNDGLDSMPMMDLGQRLGQETEFEDRIEEFYSL